MANKIEEIVASGLDEFGAQEDVVVDIVDANGERPHGKGYAVALQVDARRVGRTGRQKFVGHILRPRGFFYASSQAKGGQGIREGA